MLPSAHSVLNFRNCAYIQLQSFRFKCRKPVPEVGKTTYVYKNLPSENHPDFEDGEFLPRRLSYWPPDCPQLRPRNPIKPWWKVKEKITLYPSPLPTLEEANEYTDTPNYPEITEFRIYNNRLVEKQNRLKWYESLKSIPSIDEKMFELVNIRKHPSIKLVAWSHIYNNLPLYQNLTRTKLIKGELPAEYDSLDVSSYQKELEDSVLDAVRAHLFSGQRKLMGRHKGTQIMPKDYRADALQIENLVEDIATVCSNILSNDFPHLLQAQYDYLPDVRSWWFVGNLPLPSKHIRYTGKNLETVDQVIQYGDTNILNIRMRNPLPASEQVEKDGKSYRESDLYPIDQYNYHPARLGYPLKWNALTSIPGYWHDEDRHDFPFLSFYSRHALKLRAHSANAEFPDSSDAAEAMGIMSSFAWLNSLSAYHGFTPYQELTYPFTTQSVVTDGQYWTFMVYQMNSHSFHGDFGKENVNNLCWSSGEMKLFEECKDGVFHGVNPKVVENILKFFIRKPQPAENELLLRPYLSDDVRPQEEKDLMRFKLKRRFGQFITNSEKWYVERAKIAPWEYVYGDRNPDILSTVHLRKMPRYNNELKCDRNKFTV